MKAKSRINSRIKSEVKTKSFFDNPRIKKYINSAGHRFNIEIKGMYIDFFEELARLRKKEGITQIELARRTNIGQAELSRIESGKINPTLETIAKLAAGIGYKPAISLHKIKHEQGRSGDC